MEEKDKSKWNSSFNINILYEMNNVYVMSDYGHQKDIAFGKKKVNPHKRNTHTLKENIMLPLSSVGRPKAIPPLDEKEYLNHRKRSEKEVARDLRAEFVTREEPKHKISKIKTFLDGRVI